MYLTVLLLVNLFYTLYSSYKTCAECQKIYILKGAKILGL